LQGLPVRSDLKVSRESLGPSAVLRALPAFKGPRDPKERPASGVLRAFRDSREPKVLQESKALEVPPALLDLKELSDL
ncbi:MAG: hypothetical protein ACRD6W_01090, partial [Nitrososphaerales archaeon]